MFQHKETLMPKAISFCVALVVSFVYLLGDCQSYTHCAQVNLRVGPFLAGTLAALILYGERLTRGGFAEDPLPRSRLRRVVYEVGFAILTGSGGWALGSFHAISLN